MAKLLVVDDDTIIQKILQQRLQARGHQVLIARNGDEGVNLAKSENPNLVIMDLWMPVLDGAVATQKIKQFLDIPVVGLTSDDSVEAMHKMLQAGCVDVVFKPVNFIALEEIIDKLV
jgi:two-component system cell cycle response regulator DivK